MMKWVEELQNVHRVCNEIQKGPRKRTNEDPTDIIEIGAMWKTMLVFEDVPPVGRKQAFLSEASTEVRLVHR